MFNYNGYYSSLTYKCLVLDSELSTCLLAINFQPYHFKHFGTILCYFCTYSVNAFASIKAFVKLTMIAIRCKRYFKTFDIVNVR